MTVRRQIFHPTPDQVNIPQLLSKLEKISVLDVIKSHIARSSLLYFIWQSSIIIACGVSKFVRGVTRFELRHFELRPHSGAYLKTRFFSATEVRPIYYVLEFRLIFYISKFAISRYSTSTNIHISISTQFVV